MCPASGRRARIPVAITDADHRRKRGLLMEPIVCG
jgi:hypothetical protein